MTWDSLIAPAVVAALIASIVSVVGFLINRSTARSLHSERLAFDREQIERRVTTEISLIERKFTLDARLADHKRHQDLAEEVLTGFYEVRDLMMAVRSPLAYSSEGKSRQRDAEESEQVSKTKDMYFAVLERFDARRETVAKLMSRKYRMVAWFGDDASLPFQQLHEAIVSVTVSAQMLINTVGDGTRKSDPKSWREWETNIWWGAGNPDPVATKIDTAIESIEQVCRPILKGSL